MKFTSLERLLLLSAALLLGLIVAVPGARVLRALLALPLVFYIPGYMVLRLFGRHPGTHLEDTLYAFGVSVVIVISGGFFLNAIGHMTPLGWALLLCSISALSWAASSWRTRDSVSVHWRISLLQALTLVCAALMAAGSMFYERQAAMAYAEFKYTEFWMVSQDPANPNGLTIGIANREGKPASYEVEFMQDKQIAGAWRSIRLEPGEIWTEVLNAGLKPDGNERVEALLFKDGDYRTVYRRVWADLGRS